MKARLTLLRLTLACAALSGGLAAAAGTTSTICQDQGGVLDPTNLITTESSGSFGSRGGSYRDLEAVNQPGAPYSYAGNDPNTGRQEFGLLVPEGKYLVTSSQGSGGRLNRFGPWQAYTGHTTAAANDAYLAVNGFTSQATFLKQTVPVEPNTNYEIGVWARSPHAANSVYGDLASAPQLAIAAGSQASGVTDPLVRGDEWERGSVIFNSGNSTSIPVTLRNVSTVVQGNDFYVDDLFVRKCTLPSGSVSGKVFRDNDGNGAQNGGEPGIGGVTVTVTDKNGSVTTTTTASDGSYTFPNLPLGNGPYTVAVDGARSAAQLAGLSASTPTSAANVRPIANQTVPGGNFGYKPPATTPDTGICTATAPYVQSFDRPGPQAGINNLYTFNNNPTAVTNTDATYLMWNSIDRTGNGGYALFMNIANYAGNQGATLTNPGLLYESRVTVPAGSTINYQNYVRSHSNTGTQLQYRFFDGVSNAELKRADGAVATTGYTLQTVPAFVSPSGSVIVRIYTLKDGTVQDINALKLDDLRLTCTPPAPPVPPKAVVDKTVQNITANGPVTKETTGKPGDVLEYCITATNTGGSSATKLGLGDNIPNSSQALPGGYGAGNDIRFTGPDLVVKYLTFAADTDTGQLLAAVLNPPAPPRIVISDPALKLSVGQMFQVCFRTTIN